VYVALVKGIFYLNPERVHIFAELGRMVWPGGAVVAAELRMWEPAGAGPAGSLDDWFS
jgi:hypothetical protein